MILAKSMLGQVIKIYLSAITIHFGFCETLEMLIPKVIGKERQAVTQLRRMDRALTPGNRLRAFEEVEVE